MITVIDNSNRLLWTLFFQNNETENKLKKQAYSNSACGITQVVECSASQCIKMNCVITSQQPVNSKALCHVLAIFSSE